MNYAMIAAVMVETAIMMGHRFVPSPYHRLFVGAGLVSLTVFLLAVIGLAVWQGLQKKEKE